MKLVRESIFRPKTEEEVIQSIDNKYGLGEKISVIKNRIDADKLFDYLLRGGAKLEDLSYAILSEATEEDLKYIIADLVSTQEDLEFIVQEVASKGWGSIDEDKMKRALNNFINEMGQEELNEILNNIIMQNPEILKRRNWNDF